MRLTLFLRVTSHSVLLYLTLRHIMLIQYPEDIASNTICKMKLMSSNPFISGNTLVLMNMTVWIFSRQQKIIIIHTYSNILYCPCLIHNSLCDVHLDFYSPFILINYFCLSASCSYVSIIFSSHFHNSLNNRSASPQSESTIGLSTKDQGG